MCLPIGASKAPGHFTRGGARAGMRGAGRYGATLGMGAQVTADCLVARRGWCCYQRLALGMHSAAVDPSPRLALCWLSCGRACLSGIGLALGDVHTEMRLGHTSFTTQISELLPLASVLVLAEIPDPSTLSCIAFDLSDWQAAFCTQQTCHKTAVLRPCISGFMLQCWQATSQHNQLGHGV